MTTLADFQVTDDVTDVLAAQYNLLLGSDFQAQISNATTMSGTVTLADSDTAIQRFACNGANRIVKLPAYATANHPFFIINTTAATYTLDVQSNAGVSLIPAPLLPNGDYVLVIPDGTAGYKIIQTRTGYVCYAVCAPFNPADAQTYYFGSSYGGAPITTAAVQYITIPRAGTITRIDLAFTMVTGLGSAETSTINFRLNNTTDTAISTTLNLSNNNVIHTTGLSIQVIAGDLFEIKWLTPTWVTNPLGLSFNAQVYIT